MMNKGESTSDVDDIWTTRTDNDASDSWQNWLVLTRDCADGKRSSVDDRFTLHERKGFWRYSILHALTANRGLPKMKGKENNLHSLFR